MRKCKRIVSAMLAVSMVMGMTAFPVLAEPLGIQGESRVETGITVVSNTYTYGNAAVTSYYANGNPVTVEEYEGSTYVHLDSHPAYDDTWVKVEGRDKDKYTAIVGGGIEGNLPSTQITMKSGAVTYLIGSSSGEKAAGKKYDVEDARITVEGGSVDIIYANRSISSGNGAFSKASEQHIGTGTVTVKNNAVVGNVFGCFGYTSIDDLTINIEGNATVRESVMPGATNGTLAKGTLNVNGPGVTIGEVAGCQRTLIESLDMNFIEGEVKGVISAGSQYNQTEAEGISQWGFGDINYGIVKDADLYLGENFKYRAVFGGFQSIQEHVKEFYSRFAGSTENQKDILASYGFKEDGNLDTVIRITAASKGTPSEDGKYPYYTANRTGVQYKGVVPDLLAEPVPGVTVTSAPASVTADTENVKLEVNGEKEVGAEVKLLVPMASPSNAIQWESDNESVVSVEASSEDGTRAVLTGNDIGAAAVTASYTETINGKEYTVSDTVHVSVGGDFLVTAAPETAKIGDIISFTASAKKAAKTSGMVTATASDAAYTWTIDDGSVAEIETSEPRKMTAKAVGAGNATASVRFEDEASDNRAEGSTSFTVEAPEVSLAVPETVTLGQTFQAETKVSNYTGKDPEVLGIIVHTDFDAETMVPTGNVDEYAAIDVPAADAEGQIYAVLSYPAANGETKETTLSRKIAVTIPQVETETVYLDTKDKKEANIDLPVFVRNVLKHGGSVEVKEEDGAVVKAEMDEAAAKIRLSAADSGNTVVRVALPSGTVLASYPVIVFDASEEASAEDGGASVDMSELTVETPKLPEEVSGVVSEEQFAQKVEEADQSVMDLDKNQAVVGNKNAVHDLAAAVKGNGLLEEGEHARISLSQTPKSISYETIVEKDAAGNVTGVKVLPKTMVFEVNASKVLLDENGQVISGTQEELDLSSDKLARRLSFRFRLPVPSLVEDQYANVEHEGESIGQYTIENENGYKFITISTWHLSEFKLTFTNEKEKTSSGGSSGSSYGRGRWYLEDKAANKTGEWVKNDTGWWFRYNDGTWPASRWAELVWNGVSSWYYFNADGYMETGWLNEGGHWYYLHPYSDGTQGYMYTGWHEIGGKWYFFNTVSGGPLGSMAAGTTTTDGYTVGADGAWIR